MPIPRQTKLPPGLIQALGEETINALGSAHVAFILSTVDPVAIAKEYYLSAKRYDNLAANAPLPMQPLAEHYYKLAWILYNARKRA